MTALAFVLFMLAAGWFVGTFVRGLRARRFQREMLGYVGEVYGRDEEDRSHRARPSRFVARARR
jgi:hypothetical protein